MLQAHDEVTEEQLEAALAEPVPVPGRVLVDLMRVLSDALGHFVALDTADMHRNGLNERVDSALSDQLHDAFHVVSGIWNEDRDRVLREAGELSERLRVRNAEVDELLRSVRGTAKPGVETKWCSACQQRVEHGHACER